MNNDEIKQIFEKEDVYKTPLDLTDDNGNKIKASVYSIPLKKANEQSLGNTITEGNFEYYPELQPIQPPLRAEVYKFIKSSNPFSNAVTLLSTFLLGSRIKVEKVREDLPDNNRNKEKVHEIIENIYPDPTLTFESIMERKAIDGIVMGYTGDEVMFDNDGGFYIFPIPVTTLRMTRRDSQASILTRYYNGKPRYYWWRFRRYVQQTAGKTLYFKELQDNRWIDKTTGRVTFTPNNLATPLNFTPLGIPFNSVYPEPLWQGVVNDIYANYEAKELNLKRFSDGFFSPFMVVVTGGKLTEQGWNTINDMLKYSKGADNAFSIPIIEVTGETLAKQGTLGQTNTTSPQINFEKFQQVPDDMLNTEYLKYTSQEIRQIFGIPDVIAGLTNEYNRATSETGYIVFNHKITPMRRKLEQGFRQNLIAVGINDYKVTFVRHTISDNKQYADKLAKVYNELSYMTPNSMIDLYNDATGFDTPHVEDGNKPFFEWNEGRKKAQEQEETIPPDITVDNTNNNEEINEE